MWVFHVPRVYVCICMCKYMSRGGAAEGHCVFHYCLHCFPAEIPVADDSCNLVVGSGASPFPLHSPSCTSTSSPTLSALRGRDKHHMCTGKVMGGMAALISERLAADKANGCGEAWAPALLRNKHFHFVCLEWRMERWRWRIGGEGRESGGRGNGRGCYSILTDQSESGEICILSTLKAC